MILIISEFGANETVEEIVRQGRFENLLRKGSSSIAPYDQPLYELDGCVVAPTLGAIVSNWLILVPRNYALNFKDWSASNDFDPQLLVENFCSKVGLQKSEVIWFEHGASEVGTLVGCGADHAHIHVIFQPMFSFQSFKDAAISLSNFKWEESDAGVNYDALPDEASYLVAGCGTDAFWTSGVELAGSQFFRRVVASVASEASLWDYRLHPHHANIEATIRNFSSLEKVA